LSSPTRAIDLVFQEPAVLRAGFGRQVGMAIQGLLLVILFWVRPFDGRVNDRLLAAIEVLVIGALVFHAARLVRRACSGGGEYFDVLGSLRDLVFRAFPAPVAHVFMGEITIWIGLWRLVTRRLRPRHPEFSYHGTPDYGLLLLVIVTAPAEILLFELLIPWAPLRWLLLVLALYSTLWLVGLTVAPMVFPHHATSRHLVLRNGASACIPVPWASIAGVEPFVTGWPDMAGRLPPPLVIREGSAWLQYGGQSALWIQLREPRRVGNDPEESPVTSIVVAADDSAALIRLVEDRMMTGVCPAASTPSEDA